MTSTVLSAARNYAARRWLVFPTRNKSPLTAHGRSDATTEAATIDAWWKRWPNAGVTIATGEESGIVVLDVDIDLEKGMNGLDSLDELGIAIHLTTPTAHTPRGGIHVLFAHPGHFVKTIAGKLGPGLDIRGDGGSITLPPGPGRFWDPHLGLDTPLAPMPAWMVIPEPDHPVAQRRYHPDPTLSAYAEAALDDAVKQIADAPHGQQQQTLNREAFSIGRLAGGGGVAPGLALEALTWAAHKMPSFDPRRPWRPAEIDRIVTKSFGDGLRQPREVPHGRT